MKYFIFIFILFICFTSCVKVEGIGGTSTIKGKIIMQEFDNSNQPIKSYEAPDENVFIIFGENEIYDDDTKTHYDGTYVFSSLRKGSYKIFAYSDCDADSCSAPSLPVIIDVEITENNQIRNVEEITINKF